ELPLVIFYLVVFNVVPYKKLRDSWRGIYVGLLVFCAIVTPDASPVTMALMFAALIVLYEVSLLLARIVLAGRIKKQNQELAKEEGAAQAAAPKTKKLKAVKRK
ncbi:twin-arginine translocase subunit TatC, partial [Senegalimassilia anaerobia]